MILHDQPRIQLISINERYEMSLESGESDAYARIFIFLAVSIIFWFRDESVVEAITKNGLYVFKKSEEVILIFLKMIFLVFESFVISELGFSPITIILHPSFWSNFMRFKASLPVNMQKSMYFNL